MTITPEQVETWRGWIGRSETRRQVLDVETARRYAAAVGADLDVERAFPPLGHWAFFLEVAPPDRIGPDGHPRRDGGIMPPIPLPARMFAGAALRFDSPVDLGREAQLTLTLADVRHRAGRTGDLVFVDVERSLAQGGDTRLSECQTIVFRNEGGSTPPVEARGDVRADPGDESWTPGAVDLFRFSAATFNAHRIHYDLPYARDEEGYPGLVVHGPFTAAKLFAFAQAGSSGDKLKRFAFQARAPLFVGQAVLLRSGSAKGEIHAMRRDGVVAMSASAEG